jgi:hypothetical protein
MHSASTCPFSQILRNLHNIALDKSNITPKMLPQEANVGKISKSTTYSSMRTCAHLPVNEN